MHYAQIRKYDISNGPGVRASLFVSGCTHHCKGCFNKEAQDFNYGELWNGRTHHQFLEIVKSPNVVGVTILGGEPMDHANDYSLYSLHSLLSYIKHDIGKSIWVYSGYTFEEILADPAKTELLKWCDVLVDGKFIEELKDVRLKFKGSSNQRIIDVQKSLKEKSIVLY